MFICGSFHVEEEDTETHGLCSSPKKSSLYSASRKVSRSKSSKNPYANRGLDKFSALLADLEDKRKKIYNQKGSADILFVRFFYSDSNHVKPIVVKPKKQEKDVKENHKTQSSEASDERRSLIESSVSRNEVQQPKNKSDDQKAKKKSSFTWINMNLDNFTRPSYYLPVAIILILLMLTVFGRSFTILCTSIGWYLVPTINGGGSSNLKRPKTKKKEYTRRMSYQNKIVTDGLSSIKLSSPRSVISSIPTNKKSSGQHSHQRSW